MNLKGHEILFGPHVHDDRHQIWEYEPAKFGPLDPTATFFHSHDVICRCNRYFRVGAKPFFSVKIKMW